MATTINAATTGLIETSDGTAVLDLQTGGTTAIRVNATQAIGVGSSPSFGSAGQFLTSQGSAASPTWTSGGTGTVTSVGWTGGIVSVATATTTPAFTIAGTSGGIVYFNSASTWASSGALTLYGIVYGGGAGGAPVSTAAGTTGQFLGANTGAAPTWQTPGTSQWTTTGSNIYYSTGNVGVGTSTVTYPLDIVGGSSSGFTPGIRTQFTNSANAGCIQLGNDPTGGGTVCGFRIYGDTGGTTTYNTYRNTGGAPSHIFQSNGTEGMRLDSNPYLLVGYTSSNGSYKLQVNSQIFATNAVIATSDGRYKKDVTPITDGLNLVNKLNPVSFNWKPHQVHDFDLVNTDVGFIAQEVQSALADSPYLSNIVKSNETTLPDETKEEFLGIADGKLIPILVKAIQELTARLEALEAKVV
jgi:hypothetical protein